METVSKPRRFLFRRDEDESGVSGTGYVAEGVEFTDGRCAVRWRTDRASVAVYDSMEDVEYIHGHNGKTSIVWVDDAPTPIIPEIKGVSEEAYAAFVDRVYREVEKIAREGLPWL